MRQDYKRYGMLRGTHVEKHAVHFFSPRKYYLCLGTIPRIVNECADTHEEQFNSMKAHGSGLALA
jgi:hypothetical protein